MIEHFDWLDLLFNERLESPGGPMHVSMDTSATYACAARIALPHAVVLVDRFHLVQLTNQALTEYRRELTWATRGRRGREVDPEWAQRNRLLRAGETLTTGEAAKMHDAMRTADLAGKGTAP